MRSLKKTHTPPKVKKGETTISHKRPEKKEGRVEENNKSFPSRVDF